MISSALGTTGLFCGLPEARASAAIFPRDASNLARSTPGQPRSRGTSEARVQPLEAPDERGPGEPAAGASGGAQAHRPGRGGIALRGRRPAKSG